MISGDGIRVLLNVEIVIAGECSVINNSIIASDAFECALAALRSVISYLQQNPLLRVYCLGRCRRYLEGSSIKSCYILA